MAEKLNDNGIQCLRRLQKEEMHPPNIEFPDGNVTFVKRPQSTAVIAVLITTVPTVRNVLFYQQS